MPVEPSCSRSQSCWNSSSPFAHRALAGDALGQRAQHARGVGRRQVGEDQLRPGQRAELHLRARGRSARSDGPCACRGRSAGCWRRRRRPRSRARTSFELERGLVDGHRLDVEVAALDHPRRPPRADAPLGEDLDRPPLPAAVAAPPLVDLLLVGPPGLPPPPWRPRAGRPPGSCRRSPRSPCRTPSRWVTWSSARKLCFSADQRHPRLQRLLQELHQLVELRPPPARGACRRRTCCGRGSRFSCLPRVRQKICLRSVDEGMLSSSRYLATVRRAIWIPSG